MNTLEIKCKCGQLFIVKDPKMDLDKDHPYFLCSDCFRRRNQHTITMEQAIRQENARISNELNRINYG